MLWRASKAKKKAQGACLSVRLVTSSRRRLELDIYQSRELESHYISESENRIDGNRDSALTLPDSLHKWLLSEYHQMSHT